MVHRPTRASVKGSGFSSVTGGFTTVTINGVTHHPDDVARKVETHPDLLKAARLALDLALIKWGNLDPDANKAFEIVKTAIAKATGDA